MHLLSWVSSCLPTGGACICGRAFSCAVLLKVLELHKNDLTLMVLRTEDDQLLRVVSVTAVSDLGSFLSRESPARPYKCEDAVLHCLLLRPALPARVSRLSP